MHLHAKHLGSDDRHVIWYLACTLGQPVSYEIFHLHLNFYNGMLAAIIQILPFSAKDKMSSIKVFTYIRIIATHIVNSISYHRSHISLFHFYLCI